MHATSSVLCASARALGSQGPGPPGVPLEAAGPGPVVSRARTSPCVPLTAANWRSVGTAWSAALAADSRASGTVFTQRDKCTCAQPLQGAQLPSWAGSRSACWLAIWLPAGRPRVRYPFSDRYILLTCANVRSCHIAGCYDFLQPRKRSKIKYGDRKWPLNCENVELRGLEPLASCMP